MEGSGLRSETQRREGGTGRREGRDIPHCPRQNILVPGTNSSEKVRFPSLSLECAFSSLTAVCRGIRRPRTFSRFSFPGFPIAPPRRWGRRQLTGGLVLAARRAVARRRFGSVGENRDSCQLREVPRRSSDRTDERRVGHEEAGERRTRGSAFGRRLREILFVHRHAGVLPRDSSVYR